MAPDDLKRELKVLVVRELNLLHRTPESIGDDAPLFGDGGLGLDSLDALQIAMVVEEHFQVRIPEGEHARSIFASVSTLAAYIAEAQAQARAPGEASEF